MDQRPPTYGGSRGWPKPPSPPPSEDPKVVGEEALRACQDLQCMIEINSEHLDRLRTPNSNLTSALTKHEIRTLEGKLIKHFSKQLAIRASLTPKQFEFVKDKIKEYPSMNQWLSVVGLSQDSVATVKAKVASVEQLKDKTDAELDRILILQNNNQAGESLSQRQEDLRRLSKAIQHLKKYTDVLQKVHDGSMPEAPDTNKLELYWDSWDNSSVSTTSSFSSRVESILPQLDESGLANWYSHYGGPPLTPTSRMSKVDSSASSLSSSCSIPPPSPGPVLSPPVLTPWKVAGVVQPANTKSTPPTTPPISSMLSASKGKFPFTPPPHRKNRTKMTVATSGGGPSSSNSVTSSKNEYTSILKSKSHESEIGQQKVVPIPTTGEKEGPKGHKKSLPGAGEINSSSNGLIESTTVLTQSQAHSSLSMAHSSRTSTTVSTRTAVSCSEAPISDVDFGSSKVRKKLTSADLTTDDPEGAAPYSPTSSPKSPPNVFDNPPSKAVSSTEIAHDAGSTTLQVPKSPRTPSMGHVIRHRFTKTKFKPAKCGLCQDYMISGLKCMECKFKCHRDCEQYVPPSCGLPEDLVNYYLMRISQEGSPILPRIPTSTQSSHGGHGVDHFTSSAIRGPGIVGFGSNFQPFHGASISGAHFHSCGPHGSAYPESSSNTSSCNSSTPSSPQVIVVTSNHTPPSSASIYSAKTKFPFPDNPMKINQSESLQQQQFMHHHQQQMQIAQQQQEQQQQQQQQQTLQAQPSQQQPQQQAKVSSPLIDTVRSYDSDKTLSGSSGSAGTAYRLGSQDSTASVDDPSNSWHSQRQPSISMWEWDIPYEELNIGSKIGSGRFSTVHKGNWHGDVAIKILNMDNMDDESTLESFRKEVTTFRKTRHENLILFMGACMNPPKLAIVTSLCKGNTLYTTLHLRRDKFSMNKIVIIAQQIAQGMGYLHHRGIVHKDLKSKNIFLENGRAIITDFGLVNVARRLCARHNRPGSETYLLNHERECMSIPKGWLCYLAPEIMQTLRVQPTEAGEDLPFTKASDVYAFGTIWFELLTGEWPWKQQPPETIIWCVGRGMRPSLANLQASRDVKDILILCWKYQCENRPDFTQLNTCLEKIPKKRLARSPSHPVHLSRSVESVF